jgi:hypothetical protein
MTDFEVSPSRVRAVGEEVGQVAEVVGTAGRDLSGVSPGNPQFSFSSAILSVHSRWQQDLARAADHIASLSTKLHATATAYERTEATNEANSRITGGLA